MVNPVIRSLIMNCNVIINNRNRVVAPKQSRRRWRIINTISSSPPRPPPPPGLWPDVTVKQERDDTTEGDNTTTTTVKQEHNDTTVKEKHDDTTVKEEGGCDSDTEIEYTDDSDATTGYDYDERQPPLDEMSLPPLLPPLPDLPTIPDPPQMDLMERAPLPVPSHDLGFLYSHAHGRMAASMLSDYLPNTDTQDAVTAEMMCAAAMRECAEKMERKREKKRKRVECAYIRTGPVTRSMSKKMKIITRSMSK